MATTSPYDGAVGASPEAPPDHEPLTFARSVRPPGMPDGRLKRIAFLIGKRLIAISPWLIPLIASCAGGGMAIGIYLGAHPLPDGESRHFKLFPPWSEEVWYIGGSFLIGAVITFLLVARFKRQAARP